LNYSTAATGCPDRKVEGPDSFASQTFACFAFSTAKPYHKTIGFATVISGFYIFLTRRAVFTARLSLSKNYITKEKLRRISTTHGGTTHGGNKVKSVISGDMRLGNDTSHDGRGRAAVL